MGHKKSLEGQKFEKLAWLVFVNYAGMLSHRWHHRKALQEGTPEEGQSHCHSHNIHDLSQFNKGFLNFLSRSGPGQVYFFRA